MHSLLSSRRAVVRRPGSLCAVACALLLLVAPVAFSVDEAQREIESLLDFVAASGCEFERNGDRHSAVDAADHLRLKYNRGRRYAKTAEQFIDRLATESSWSGKPYRVYCAGNVEPSGAWLHRALREQRSTSPGEVSGSRSD